MSAFIVDRVHVDLLVSLACHGPRDQEPGTPVWQGHSYNHGGQLCRANDANTDEIGTMLAAENHASVNYRYDETEEPDPYSYTFRRLLTPVEALKAIRCYEYQSCEHPEWDGSRAKALCDSLRDRLIAYLPGYDEAPWEWTEQTLTPARR